MRLSILKRTIIIGVFWTIFAFPVLAQNIDIKIDKVDLKPISIPLFDVPIDFNNFSIFSWITFLAGVAVIAVIAFWIFLLIKISLKALQSEGKPETLNEIGKQARSVLIGVAITLAFPIILSIAGIFLGLGNIFAWPKMFSLCYGGSGNLPVTRTFYYQVYIAEGEKVAEERCNAK